MYNVDFMEYSTSICSSYQLYGTFYEWDSGWVAAMADEVNWAEKRTGDGCGGRGGLGG